MLQALRNKCGKYIKQMTHYKQFPADACALLGQDGYKTGSSDCCDWRRVRDGELGRQNMRYGLSISYKFITVAMILASLISRKAQVVSVVSSALALGLKALMI